jgi:hypothetical protein
MAAARESIRNVVCGNLQWPGAAQAVASAQYVIGRLTLATSCINYPLKPGPHATLSTCTARPIRSASTRLLAQPEYRPVLSGMVSRSSSAPGFNGSTPLSGVTDGGYQQVPNGPADLNERPSGIVRSILQSWMSALHPKRSSAERLISGARWTIWQFAGPSASTGVSV